MYALIEIMVNLKAHFQVWHNFWTTENPVKMMKNVFYFTAKALFILKIFKSLSWLFGHVSKRVDKKDKINFKFKDVTAWLSSYLNTHIAEYLKK